MFSVVIFIQIKKEEAEMILSSDEVILLSLCVGSRLTGRDEISKSWWERG